MVKIGKRIIESTPGAKNILILTLLLLIIHLNSIAAQKNNQLTADRKTVVTSDENQYNTSKIDSISIVKSLILQSKRELKSGFPLSKEAELNSLLSTRLPLHLKKKMVSLLCEHARNQRDFNGIYTYFTTLKAINDSINAKTALLREHQLSKQYKLKKRQNRLELAKLSYRKKQIHWAIAIISLLILAGSFILIYALVRFRDFYKLEKAERMFRWRLHENIEQEREQLAIELHDDIAHTLLMVLTTKLPTKTTLIVNDCIQQIRSISRQLHPALFKRFGLIAALEQYFKQFEREHDILVRFEHNYNGLASKSKELLVYRIIEQALDNVRKHTNSHAVFVSITEGSSLIEVIIKDRGTGFDIKHALKQNTYGLAFMHEACTLLSGKVALHPTADGTAITISIPKREKLTILKLINLREVYRLALMILLSLIVGESGHKKHPTLLRNDKLVDCACNAEMVNFAKSAYYSSPANYKKLHDYIKSHSPEDAADAIICSFDPKVANSMTDDTLLILTQNFIKEFEFKISPEKRMHLYTTIGHQLFNKQELKLSKKALHKALHIAPQSSEAVWTNNTLSALYSMTGDQSSAFSYSQKALSVAKKTGNGKLIRRTNFYIGYLYFLSNQPKKAQSIFDALRKELAETKDTALIVELHLFNLTRATQDIKIDAKKLDQSFKELERVTELASPLYQKWPLFEIRIRLIEARLIGLAGNPEKADSALSIAFDKSVYYSIPHFIRHVQFHKSYTDLQRNIPIKNHNYYSEQIPTLRKNNNFLFLSDVYQILALDALSRKSADNAYSYFSNYIRASEARSPINIRNALHRKFVLFQKKNLDERIRIKVKAIEQKNGEIIVLLLTILLVSVVFSLRYFYHKKKLLTLQKKQFEHFSKTAIKRQDLDKKRIAESMLQHIILPLKTIKNEDDQNTERTKFLNEIVEKINQLLYNVSPVNKAAGHDFIDAMAMLATNIRNTGKFAEFSKIEYKNTLTLTEQLNIIRIAQEAVSNAIKYSKGTIIRIEIKDDDRRFCMLVSDNGRGFDVSQTLQSVKTYGMWNLFKRAELIGAELNVSSGKSGTELKLSLNR